MTHEWVRGLPGALAAVSLVSGCCAAGYSKPVFEQPRAVVDVEPIEPPPPVAIEYIAAPAIVGVSRERRGDRVTLRFDWSVAARNYVGAATMQLDCNGSVTTVSPYWLGDMRMEVSVPLFYGAQHCTVYVQPVVAVQSSARVVRQPIRYRLDGAW